MRELVWLESNSFAAWGCSECHWLVVNSEVKLSEKPSIKVKDAFKQHDCTLFPRYTRKKPTTSRP